MAADSPCRGAAGLPCIAPASLIHCPNCCRFGPLSLVCKQFKAAALLSIVREANVVLRTLPAMRSFTSFLAEHGQNLQRLTISSHDGTAEGEAAAAAATADCLSAAGARGQLSKLRASGSIRSTEWLVAMPSLRRLQLYSQPHSSPLHVSSAISSLTALSELELEGAITFSAGTHLPASIECLALSRDPSAAIPGQASVLASKRGDLWISESMNHHLSCVFSCVFPTPLPPSLQVAQLPLLASLCVSACNYSSASVNQLSHLRGSLTRLDIGSGWMPGSLSVVTQLQDLKLRDSYMPQEGLVSAALPHLSQLTRLVSIRLPAVELHHPELLCLENKA